MNSNKGFVVPLIIAIVALLAVGGGYYVLTTTTLTCSYFFTGYRNTETGLCENFGGCSVPSKYVLDSTCLKNVESPIDINPNVPVATKNTVAAVDETKDWKTYTNTQYGFEISYPSDWKISTENGFSLISPNTDKILKEFPNQPATKAFDLDINVLTDNNRFSGVRKQTTFNGMPAEQVTSESEAGADTYIYLVRSFNNLTYTYGITAARNDVQSKILSTFKFITPVIKTVTDQPIISNSPAYKFIEEIKKLSGINSEITKEHRVLSFGPSISVGLDGYTISNDLDQTKIVKIPILQNSVEDYMNSGDGTFNGSNVFKNNNIICVRSYYLEGELDPYSAETFFCADHDVPPTGKDEMRLLCSSRSCNISGVNTVRSDFYYVTDRNIKIKILIDGETRLRDLTKGENDGSQSIIKWADFYPLLTNPSSDKEFDATIYGDKIDENTFKANWIVWPALRG